VLGSDRHETGLVAHLVEGAGLEIVVGAFSRGANGHCARAL
jgi:hypothetical protein